MENREEKIAKYFVNLRENCGVTNPHFEKAFEEFRKVLGITIVPDCCVTEDDVVCFSWDFPNNNNHLELQVYPSGLCEVFFSDRKDIDWLEEYQIGGLAEQQFVGKLKGSLYK
jgi:hypothetical protein